MHNMERIKQTGIIKNEEVLERVKEEKSMLHVVRKMKVGLVTF